MIIRVSLGYGQIHDNIQYYKLKTTFQKPVPINFHSHTKPICCKKTTFQEIKIMRLFL